jgi:RNA-binding protein with serine-rich domain 1
MPRSSSSSRSRSRSRSSASSSRSRYDVLPAHAQLMSMCLLRTRSDIPLYLTRFQVLVLLKVAPSPLAAATSLFRSSCDRSRGRGRAGRVRSPIRNSNSPARRGSSPPAGTVVVVRNLTRNTNSEHIKEIFSHYGDVKSVRLDMDERSKLRFAVSSLFTLKSPPSPSRCSLGTAWVEYADRSSCEAAIDHFDGGQVDGNTVSVKISVRQASPREVPPPARRNWGRASPPRGGAGGGRCSALACTRLQKKSFCLCQLILFVMRIFRRRTPSPPPRRRSPPRSGRRSPSPRRR